MSQTDQMSLFDTARRRTSTTGATGRQPKPAPRPVPVAAPRAPKRPAEDVLNEWCSEGEGMIFLIGQNPNICAVRTFSSTDNGQERWMSRQDAENILRGHRYVQHGTQRRARPGKPDWVAKVYWQPGQNRGSGGSPGDGN